VANAPPSPPAKIALRKLLKFRLGVQLSADRGRKRDPKTGHVQEFAGLNYGLPLRTLPNWAVSISGIIYL
jgi:hypothetical protein